MNSGVQNLYGGRMTEVRIRAVHSAISDAINHLHKSLESCPTEQAVAEDPSGLKVSRQGCIVVGQLSWVICHRKQKCLNFASSFLLILSHPLRFRCCCTRDKRSHGCSGERVKGRVEEFWVSSRMAKYLFKGKRENSKNLACNLLRGQ